MAKGNPCSTDHESVQFEPSWYRNWTIETVLRHVKVLFEDRAVKIS